MTLEDSPRRIGTLQENSLHRQLKSWYRQPRDEVEKRVDAYVIDIVRGANLIEFQTGNFTALKRKFADLLQRYPVHLVYPVAHERWILRMDAAGERLSRRKSPKRGRALEVFTELVRIPHYLSNPNFSLEVLLIRDEIILVDDGQGSWRRRGWSVHDRLLIDVVESVRFEHLPDYAELFPAALPPRFGNQELAEGLGCRLSLAQKMTYTLRKAGLVRLVGKRGQAHLFELAG